MIAFDSPEADVLRAIALSRSAIQALWYTALGRGRLDWADWAGQQPTDPGDANALALRCLHAAAKGDFAAAELILTVIKSLPADQRAQFYVRAALAISVPAAP